MSIEAAIRDALAREITKHVARHEARCRSAARNRRRFRLRSGLEPGPSGDHRPGYWALHPHFDPYYLRSRLDCVAHGLARSIRARTYHPHPSLSMPIPKPGGGTRQIALFSLPDSAVSYWLTSRLLQRNGHRFSSYAFAYRKDRNAHHAIHHLMDGIRGKDRVFALEYDFAKYFDSIAHEYLYKVLGEHFSVDKRELLVIRRFLSNPIALGNDAYLKNDLTDRAGFGIPQGTSISLFLANVACFELDREIESLGVVFARYADDTLIIADTYEKANACARLLITHGNRSGTEINFAKSPGISLLTRSKNSEFKSKSAVDFLGHSLSVDGVGLAQRTLNRIKANTTRIIYKNLLLLPKREMASKQRIGKGFKDWDLVTCINELRRYVYGQVTEADLRLALKGETHLGLTRGALAFYPTVDAFGESDLIALDGWVADTLMRAYRKRLRLLEDLGILGTAISKDQLIRGTWYRFKHVPNETRLPSFLLALRYIQRASKLYGYSRFPSPSYEYR